MPKDTQRIYSDQILKNIQKMIQIFLLSKFQLVQIFKMIKAASQGETIQYVTYKDLLQPSLESITVKNIIEAFQSKQWRRNFDAITHLRQANKYYGKILMQQILPQVSTHIIAQIDNLRSNNSKQALTLSCEIIQHQNLQKLDKAVICPLVSVLFTKTTSQKAFLKKQALNAVEKLINKFNPYLLEEISNQILSINSQISELGVKTLAEYIEKNKISEVNGQFYSLLSRTINGKRAFLQKKGRQILNGFKTRLGAEKLLQTVENAQKEGKVTEQQLKSLVEQIKKEEPQVKTQQSLKDYLKMKKKPESSV